MDVILTLPSAASPGGNAAAGPVFRIVVQEQNESHIVIWLDCQEIDFISVPEISAAIYRILEDHDGHPDRHNRDMILDMQSVRFIDSTTMGMLIDFHKRLRPSVVYLTGVNAGVMRMLQVLQLMQLFVVVPTVEMAVEAVSERSKSCSPLP